MTDIDRLRQAADALHEYPTTMAWLSDGLEETPIPGMAEAVAFVLQTLASPVEAYLAGIPNPPITVFTVAAVVHLADVILEVTDD